MSDMTKARISRTWRSHEARALGGLPHEVAQEGQDVLGVLRKNLSQVNSYSGWDRVAGDEN